VRERWVGRQGQQAGIYRERMERQRDTETDRKRDREIERQRDRETERKREREM
jgi:hypothetical protein